MRSKTKDSEFLTCERNWVYYTLIATAGFFGAYTYLLRGNVFCNAQTGNVVLLGLSIGSREWGKALYYLIPIFAYLFGAFISELLPNIVKRRLAVRWDTLSISLEMAVVFVLGFIPDSAPVQISQIAVNFIASIQYNTFRRAEGIPVATTFVTNHIRQVGAGLAHELSHLRKPDNPHHDKFMKHLCMLIFFLLGVIAGTIFCLIFAGRAIWITLISLGTVFCVLLHADLTTEKYMLEKIPHGH